MDLLVHCSLREGLARVLPQALISGKPVVTYDVDGASQAVEDGVTGSIVPAGRMDLLTAALARLAADASLRARMGAAGRASCAERFRARVMVDRIEALYEHALSEKSCR